MEKQKLTLKINIDRNLIQILRALASVMVIIHHVLAAVDYEQFRGIILILNMHVCVFFVISGYLYQKNLEKYQKTGKIKFVLKKGRELMLPYLFWSLILFIGVPVVYQLGFGGAIETLGYKPFSFGETVFYLLTFQGYYVQILWFLYALFVIFLLNIFISNRLITIPIILLLAFISAIDQAFLPVPTTPYIVEKILAYIVYFVVGRFICLKIKNGAIKIHIIPITVIVAVCEVVQFVLEKFGSESVYVLFGERIFKHFTILGRMAVLLIIAFLINEMFGKKISSFFVIIGNHSMYLYLMHQPYIIVAGKILLTKLHMPDAVTIPVLVIAAVGIPILLYELIIKRVSFLKLIMFGEYKRKGDNVRGDNKKLSG